ncbi:uncharacterized protein [Oscarella lobularis]|uniref:uncharacterized protein n=1 Tax=Oscarella lobularis TaxID=121494 RepID=UPI0033130B98
MPSLSSCLVLLRILVLVTGSTREKEVEANVNDFVWALNGDTVLLNCSHPATSGDTWSQRAANGKESPAPPAVRTATVGSTFTVLMSPSLNGTSYKCILQDFQANRVFESGWNMLLLGEEIRVSCTRRATSCVNIGETLNKHCVVTGLPEPNVTVSKISGRALATRLPLANRSGLTFSDVTLTDRGTYRLAAENVLQEIREDISVRAEEDICWAPVVVSFLISDPIVCLHNVRINFTVKGIPAPNITWSWSTLLSEKITISSHINSIYSDEITSVVMFALEIQNVHRGDSNICMKADNGASPSLQRCVRLNITCDIDPPHVELRDRTESSLSLQISNSLDNSRLQATEYFITYWQSISSVKNLTIKRDHSAQTNVRLIDLNQMAPYNVRVVARNEPYYSRPADHVFATLKENDCRPTLQQVHAQPPMIKWSYICEGSRMLKEITSYVIVYESSTDYRRFSVEKVVTEYSFCELLFNATYNLSVTAVAQNGALRKSNILSVSISKTITAKASPENTGLIAGISVLSTLFVALGLVSIYLLCYNKRSKKQNQKDHSTSGGSASKTSREMMMQSNHLYESAKSLFKGDSKQPSVPDYAQIS